MTMKIATLLVPVLFAAAILAESMQKWKELYRTGELKKFTSNGTKFSEMWSDCSKSIFVAVSHSLLHYCCMLTQ